MRTKSIIIFLILLILIIIYNYYKPRNRESIATFDVSLKEMIYFDFTKNIHDVKELYPNGEYIKGSKRNRRLSLYYFNANLIDINNYGRVGFHQDTENIHEKNNNKLDMITISLNRIHDLSIKKQFKNLCDYIITVNDTVFPSLNPRFHDASYAIMFDDNSGIINIDITIDTLYTNNIRIYVQHSHFINRSLRDSTSGHKRKESSAL